MIDKKGKNPYELKYKLKLQIGLLTENKLLRPHTTSFNLLVGAHPSPSIEFWRNIDKQISPSSLILGCQSLVKHLTVGG